MQVFANGRYVLLAAASGFAIFVLTTWLPNIGLVWQIATSSAISISDKATILTSLVGSITTNFTVFSASLSVAVATLFGANVAMAAYMFRTRRRLTGYHWRAGGAASVGGLASGLFGIGCAACGSIALTPFLSLIGVGGFVATLPFGGEEFSVLGIGLLSLSFALTARMIAKPAVCTIRDSDAETPGTTNVACR